MTAAIAACTWDAPGADRYTGTVPAAIASYGFPVATQAALIDAFERRDFTDSVVIDRDSIRGKAHDYAPHIRDMHFGSAGRVCRSVTRTKWSALHTESAVVICAGGECIAWPAVCGNVFRLTRRADEPGEPGARSLALPVGLPDASLDESAVQLLGLPGGSSDAMTPADPAPSFGAPGIYAGLATTYSTVIVSTWTPPCPVAPVPEPETYALLLAGLAALATWRKRA